MQQRMHCAGFTHGFVCCVCLNIHIQADSMGGHAVHATTAYRAHYAHKTNEIISNDFVTFSTWFTIDFGLFF